MSNEQKLQSPLKAKYTIITDPKTISELDKLPLYIAPNETEETFDQEVISGTGHDLQKSSEEVGQLRPIEVAVWMKDPNKDSTNSTERVHMRIINGRHRYKANPKWRRVYYDFSGFATEENPLQPVIEYGLAKAHFDMQKKATREERVVWVRNMNKLAMKMGIPKPECCNWVVKLAEKQGVSSPHAIREVCDPEFKNKEMAERKKEKTFEATGRETTEVKKLKKVAGEKFAEAQAKALRLENEKTQLEKEIIGLQNDNKEKNKVMEDLQQQLRLVANINHEHKCECGRTSTVKVDSSSGTVVIEKKK